MEDGTCSAAQKCLRSDPLALVAEGRHGIVLTAVNRSAAQSGLVRGQRLADARALYPELRVEPADPVRDSKALQHLTDWCGRYSPWVCKSGDDGILIDMTGGAHLFGGEQALLDDLVSRLGSFGVTARAAMADTPGAAHALARYGGLNRHMTVLCPFGETRRALKYLPLDGLRLNSDVVEGLERLGIKSIGDLYTLERAPLSVRFGGVVLRQLDKALGNVADPVSPDQPVPSFRARISFADAIARFDDVKRAIEKLTDDLSHLLEREQKGARRLRLLLFRTDGVMKSFETGTAQPSRDRVHLARLFHEKLDRLSDWDAGFGIEMMELAAPVTDPLIMRQANLPEGANDRARQGRSKRITPDLGHLVDRLGNRLGLAKVNRMVPQASHIPEQAVVLEPMAARASADRRPREPHDWRIEQDEGMTRPLHMLPCPEPVEVMAEVPDGPPIRFKWRRVSYEVARAEGPERIAPEWWRGKEKQGAWTRDYYRLEDAEGHRFWLYRDGLYGEQGDLFDNDTPPVHPRWYMHGVFA